MNYCSHPLCGAPALWTPVIVLPTVRSVGMTKELVKTPRPTYLVMKDLVCKKHRDNYNVSDYIPETEWKHIREGALDNGFIIPETSLITVEFRPLNWHPLQGYLPLDRGV